MSDPVLAAAAPPPAPEPARGWRALSPRARFRARLDRDPRRWVLLIVALEGLLAPLVGLSEKRDSFLDKGYGAAILMAVLATLPPTAVLTMLVHGRLLYWTGKVLKGAARPHELHAAFAWSQLPFVLTAWPLVVEFPLRVAAADADPVPVALQRAIEVAAALSEPVAWIATVAGIAGAFLWIEHLAEAQRFSAWRALANQLMAGLLLVGLLFGGVSLAVAAIPKSNGIVYGTLGSAFVLLALGAGALIERSRRRR